MPQRNFMPQRNPARRVARCAHCIIAVTLAVRCASAMQGIHLTGMMRGIHLNGITICYYRSAVW
jgi:hypothetical protein